jgi:hypothetical protein
MPELDIAADDGGPSDLGAAGKAVEEMESIWQAATFHIRGDGVVPEQDMVREAEARDASVQPSKEGEVLGPPTVQKGGGDPELQRGAMLHTPAWRKTLNPVAMAMAMAMATMLVMVMNGRAPRF